MRQKETQTDGARKRAWREIGERMEGESKENGARMEREWREHGERRENGDRER